MRTSVKIGLVAAGYVGAFVIASLVVMLYVALTSGPDRQGSDGMYAFGDSMLFLAVFVMAGLPSTGAAPYFFLRPSRSFWRALSIVAIVVATTGLLALVGYLAWQNPALAADLPWWFALSPIRILMSPLFALVFLLAALFAPNRFARIALLGGRRGRGRDLRLGPPHLGSRVSLLAPMATPPRIRTIAATRATVSGSPSQSVATTTLTTGVASRPRAVVTAGRLRLATAVAQ